MKLAVFYHLHPMGNWKLIYDSQMHKLCASGLYTAASHIHVGVNSGSNLELPYALPKIQVAYNQDHLNEFDTLYAMHDYCLQNTDAKVLYFHCKGVSHKDDVREINVQAWRQYLEYFVVDNWQECVKLLDSWDCVGNEWGRPASWLKHDGEPHYSGNFWWATAKYIAGLDKGYLQEKKRTHERPGTYAEFWIGTKNPKAYCFHWQQDPDNLTGLYNFPINPADYMREMK